MGEIYKNGPIELRLGDWREVLADVEQCNALICDPPYSERTHKGQRTGNNVREGTICFDHITENDCESLARQWCGRSFWAVIFGDHQSFCHHESAWERANWLVFAPVPWVKPDAPPRFSGDGPSCDAEWIMVARKRSVVKCGSIRGHYIGPCGKRGDALDMWHPTQKPLWIMRQIVRQYTRPGDLIVDCYSGSCTTLLAAATEGRRAIGAEIDPETFELAKNRLSAGYTGLLPGLAA